jgi:hypothetical protein
MPIEGAIGAKGLIDIVADGDASDAAIRRPSCGSTIAPICSVIAPRFAAGRGVSQLRLLAIRRRAKGQG